MKRTISTLFAGSMLLAGNALADDSKPQPAQAPAAGEQASEALKFEGENKEVGSYFMGYQAGYGLVRMLMQEGMNGVRVSDLDEQALVDGLKDAINQVEPSKDASKSMQAIQALSQQLEARKQELAEANKKLGDAYRAKRAEEEGVQTTESGLMYKVVTKGEGETYQAPAEGQMDFQTRFKVRYAGRLIDGTEFDSSGDQAVEFDLRVVPGFSEALRLMPVGSTWELILKPELAYGDQGAGAKIQPGSTLIFELSLEEIIKPEAKPASAVTPPVPVPAAPKN